MFTIIGYTIIEDFSLHNLTPADAKKIDGITSHRICLTFIESTELTVPFKSTFDLGGGRCLAKMGGVAREEGVAREKGWHAARDEGRHEPTHRPGAEAGARTKRLVASG
jgi:hypothetical protein